MDGGILKTGYTLVFGPPSTAQMLDAKSLGGRKFSHIPIGRRSMVVVIRSNNSLYGPTLMQEHF